jgi:hypothetical protein
MGETPLNDNSLKEYLVDSCLSLVANQLSPAKPGSFNRFLGCDRNDPSMVRLRSPQASLRAELQGKSVFIRG